jgi:F-type H+-transporting ATPase subunit b
MNMNLTMIGQLIAFVIFVLLCMKYVWPPLTQIMRERRKAIADGLAKAADAERQLSEASSAAGDELEAAKQQSAELIEQARQRGNQIVEDAKGKAREEAERIQQGAEASIEQDVNRAREALRARVSELAVQGAEQILEKSVDREAHQEMLNKLASEL